jgi:hypothetical protein
VNSQQEIILPKNGKAKMIGSEDIIKIQRLINERVNQLEKPTALKFFSPTNASFY